MNGSNDLGSFLMLALFAIFVWFASRLQKGFRRERRTITHALENSRELLATNKISSEEFETIKRGLENS